MIISFKSGFDIENQKYLDLSSNLKLNPIDKFSVDLGIVNDLNFGGVKQGSALFDLETGSTEDWGNHWNFKYGFVYDTVLQDFKVRDIMIKKDLHCWDVTYTY